MANHEYRVFPKGRPAVQYADSLLWGQTGTVSARQWTVFPDAWTLNYTMTGTDNIYVDAVGYWAEPRDGRGDVNGLTPGYGFVPLKNPLRLFSTATSGAAQVLGRKLTNGEVVSINITKAGIPSTAAAVSGVYHADRATAANRFSVYGGPGSRGMSSLAQSAFNTGRETANTFVAPTWGSVFVNLWQGGSSTTGGSADINVDLFGYFENSINTLGLFRVSRPLRILDTRTGSPFAAGEVRRVVVTGQSFPHATGTLTINTDTKGVALMITAMNGPASPSKSLISVYPGTSAASSVYVLASYANLVTNNGLHVRLGDDGSLNFKASNTTHLIVDCVGLFRPAFLGGNFTGVYIRAQSGTSTSPSSSSFASSRTVLIVVICVAVVLALAIVATIVVVLKMKKKKPPTELELSYQAILHT